MTQKSKIKNQRSKPGFTLIELLVVISILGLLAGLLISNVSGVRERARDVQRKSDLDQMKKALRMYYNDNNGYPLTASFPAAGTTFTGIGGTGSMVYMKLIPGDPVSGSSYGYYQDGTCSDDFRIVATLENKSDLSIAKSQLKCSRACGAPVYTVDSNYVVCAD